MPVISGIIAAATVLLPAIISYAAPVLFSAALAARRCLRADVLRLESGSESHMSAVATIRHLGPRTC